MIRETIAGLGSEATEMEALVTRYRPESRNGRLHEVAGYSYIYLGDLSAARRALSKAVAIMPNSDWQQDIVDRAVKITSLLDQAGTVAAIEQLDV